MDLYCSDRKLSELTDNPLGDFLDSDVFTPPVNTPMDSGFGCLDTSSSGDNDWLDNFFQDDPVLNDRMISDALPPALLAPGQQKGGTGGVQSEHSYSSLHGSKHHDAKDDSTTLSLSKTSLIAQQAQNTTDTKELDMELTAVNPNNMTLSTGHTTIPTTSTGNGVRLGQTATSDLYIKSEPLDLSLDSEMQTVTVTRSTNPQTLLKQPTIILQTTAAAAQQATLRQERLVLPKVEIKMESQSSSSASSQQLQQQRYTTHSLMSSPEHSTESYDGVSLPPTPPSSTNSDSDGCDRSPPSSPHRSSRHHRPASPIIQQPFFMSPIPTSGVLMLTEEEKRTLISEGYPIPGKLPLTKQEEKNLKKIRRKIKNKISAQESRRKKKEYLETLERKVEAFSQENVDLRKKVDNLQNNNQSLLSQLHKLQAVVRNFRPLSPSGTHTTSTCLMVLVLCFAVMLGSWSPMSLSMGYSSSLSSASSSPSPSYISHSSSHHQYSPSPEMLAAAVGVRGGNRGSDAAGPVEELGLRAAAGAQIEPEGEPKSPSTNQYGPYATPNIRSRVLLGLKDEDDEADEEFGPHAPFSYKWLLGGIFGSSGCAAGDNHAPAVVNTAQSHHPTVPKVNMIDVEIEINQTGEGHGGAEATSTPMRQPDMAVTTSSKPINATS